MVDRLKNIPAQFMDFWNRYTKKQQTMIISIVAVVILALFILWWVVSRPNWEQLGGPYGNTTEASEVTSILADNGIKYNFSKADMMVYVEAKKLSESILLLGANNLPSTGGMSWEDVTTNSMTTTDGDRQIKNSAYMQDNIRKQLLVIDGIDDALVWITGNEQGSTILSRDRDPFASVTLTTNNNFNKANINAIAQLVANAMGSKSLENVRIVNQDGGLFSGINESDQSVNLESSYTFQQEVKNKMALELESLVMNGKFADDALIVPNLAFNMDVVEQVYTEYLGPNNQIDGVVEEIYDYSTQNNSNVGGGPAGTDSNDGTDTDYMMPDDSNASGNTEINKTKYKLSERITQTVSDRGGINKAESKLAVSLKNIRIIRQVDLEEQGLLEGTTYEAYKLANSSAIPMTEDEDKAVVLDDVRRLLASAAGINENDIVVTLYDIPVFQDKVTPPVPWSLILQIAMFALIAGLLIFVVFKGTAPVEITELEPELSVEQLLATTKENQSLEDIEFSEKSETRKMIEKFVDENPEAVAQLLRNWLNEDWEG